MKLLGLTVDSLLTTEYIEMTLEEFMITGPGDLVSTRKGMRPYTNLTSLKTWKSKVWCTKKLLALDPDGSLGYTITTLDDWLRSKPENVNNPEESHDEDNDGTESIPDRIGDTGIPKGVQ